MCLQPYTPEDLSVKPLGQVVWAQARPMEDMRVGPQPRRGTSLIRSQIALAGQSVGMSPSASPIVLSQLWLALPLGLAAPHGLRGPVSTTPPTGGLLGLRIPYGH